MQKSTSGCRAADFLYFDPGEALASPAKHGVKFIENTFIYSQKLKSEQSEDQNYIISNTKKAFFETKIVYMIECGYYQ